MRTQLAASFPILLNIPKTCSEGEWMMSSTCAHQTQKHKKFSQSTIPSTTSEAGEKMSTMHSLRCSAVLIHDYILWRVQLLKLPMRHPELALSRKTYSCLDTQVSMTQSDEEEGNNHPLTDG